MIDIDVMEAACSKILSYSGIYVADSQKELLGKHIQKKADSLSISPKEYIEKVQPQTKDFDEIINLVTVNETYFFREEKHFDFLKNEVFPNYVGKNLTLWTCCCSTGEEPISLLALALSMGIKMTIYASDIDDNALETLKRGRYSSYSLRFDGKKYHELLYPYCKRSETEIVFDRDFLSNIHSFKFNLIQDTQLPFYEKVDILFMRNVFIYFDKQTRINVTRKVSERLKDNGFLFFSMNEIGSIDKTIIPEYLSKTNSGVVYYFLKSKLPSASEVYKLSEKKKKADEQAAKMKEKLKNEVEKVRKNKNDDKVSRALAAIASATSAASKMMSSTSLKTSASSAPEKEIIDYKALYEKTCEEINRQNFENGRAIARGIEGSAHKAFSFFLQGYVEYYADNRAAAEPLFAYAENITKDFWPAFFYHGMVLRDLGKSEKANACFKKCKQILTELGNSNPYDFALDSFSPAYIYSLCNTFQGEKE